MICVAILFVVLLKAAHAFNEILSDDNKAVLAASLQRKADAVLDKHGAAHLKDDLIVIGDGAYKLAHSLTRSYLGRSTFVIGVTGGSASQGNFSWPYSLRDLLQDEFQMTVELRNAAQGSTSQVITAPCINALVGAKIDLLMWEFAMNADDGTDPEQDPADVDDLRIFTAESWIREAVNSEPGAIGFLHFWDMIGIEKWQKGQEPIPNRQWKSTNKVMEHYSHFYNSYFGLAVMPLLNFLKLGKPDFMRDGRHPNTLGYDIAMDLMRYAIFTTWAQGLKPGARDKLNDKSSQVLFSKVIPTPYVESMPHGVLPYPRVGSSGHCLMSMVPQYGTNSAIYGVVCEHGRNCVRMEVEDVATASIGKADSRRTDRKIMFQVEECEVNDNTGGLYFHITAKPSILLLDCGPVGLNAKGQWHIENELCKKYSVYLDGLSITNQKHTENYKHVHIPYNWISPLNITHELIDSDGSKAPHLLRICGPPVKQYSWKKEGYTYDFELLARVVILEEAYEYQDPWGE